MDDSRQQASGPSLPPHPTLPDYYGRADQRPQFVRQMFDATARDYDRVEGPMALWSGRWYRRNALQRAGLLAGMSVLDVAIGTGLVAREASRLAGPGKVVGLDPSAGMLLEARRNLGVSGVLGLGEQIPVRAGSFEFLSMGYALRHLGDLKAAFAEFFRVLKPGGTVCILELTRPGSRLGDGMLRFYLKRVVPVLARLRTRNAETAVLARYFWDTVETCVAPDAILRALEDAGFAAVERTLAIGLFSEYTGRKPGPGESAATGVTTRDEGNFFVRAMGR